MDNTEGKKSKGKSQSKRFDFSFRERSSSEPDLSDHSSSQHLLDRWQRFPHESITVDELKFFRRRKPTGIQTGSNLHTRSNICLYDKSDTTIPFSALRTEYNRQFGVSKPVTTTTGQRPELIRRSTSVKLLLDITAAAAENKNHLQEQKPPEIMPVATTEHNAKFQPYTEDEALRCRRSLVKKPDHSFIQSDHIDDGGIPAATPITFNGNLIFLPQQQHSEPHFDSKHKSEKHSAQICHLNLEGELNYQPEYRSQFVTFPIEKSHSIPQISNIHFSGKFNGIPEYQANYKYYDQYVKSAPIKKPGHLSISGTIDSTGEYLDQFKTPDKTNLTPVTLAKKSDQSNLIGAQSDNQQDNNNNDNNRQAEYTESFSDPKVTSQPERGKPRPSILSLKGQMDYMPEYRCTYQDFPRTRPITKKPSTSIRLGNNTTKNMSSPTEFLPIKPNRTKFESNPMITNIHDPNLQDLPFMCQPEVRRARKDLLIKERQLRKETTDDDPQSILPSTIEKSIIGLPTDDSIGNQSIPPHSPLNQRNTKTIRTHHQRHQQQNQSPSFKLTVKNVDDPGGTFKKTSPKFGRRSSQHQQQQQQQQKYQQHEKEANKLRNRTKIIEGNRKYGGQHPIDQYIQHKKIRDGPSFIVLNEPCKQSKWMKSSWYD